MSRWVWGKDRTKDDDQTVSVEDGFKLEDHWKPHDSEGRSIEVDPIRSSMQFGHSMALWVKRKVNTIQRLIFGLLKWSAIGFIVVYFLGGLLAHTLMGLGYYDAAFAIFEFHNWLKGFLQYLIGVQ